MDKWIRRPAGLSALFWRYLITTGVAVVLLAILWWIALTTMMRCGIVYPANTAASGVEAVSQALSSGELDVSEIPYYYRWAIFSPDGQIQDAGSMNQKHLAYAEAALAGERDPQGMFYAQYHQLVEMPDGTTCVLQYDYSMPYGAEVLQRRLPEFQTCALIVLLAAWLLAGAISTRHFAGLLRRDAALLTGAAEAIAQRRLDVPISRRAKVREFGETLVAMDVLRQNLAQSLERQWAMEQQRQLEVAALTHDLKTPLSVISGNAELLEEDDLTPGQRESVDAILRSALRVQDYVAQLRAMTGSETGLCREKESIMLPKLAAGWQEVGRSLCGTKQVKFFCTEAPRIEVTVYQGDLDRAVSNLLDNAVRYTSAGGAVTLSISVAEGILTIAVEDTGPGFSAEALVRGDQAFYTSDISRPQEGHKGLGLFLAGQTARRHGGSLHLSNTEHGAKTELTVPLVK